MNLKLRPIDKNNFLFSQVAEPHGWDANDVMSLVGKVLQNSVDEDDLITGELFGIPTLMHSPPPYWL